MTRAEIALEALELAELAVVDAISLEAAAVAAAQRRTPRPGRRHVRLLGTDGRSSYVADRLAHVLDVGEPRIATAGDPPWVGVWREGEMVAIVAPVCP